VGIHTKEELEMSDERFSDDQRKQGLDSEEFLLWELERYPRKKLTKNDVHRVALMVNEYNGKIKAHLHEQQEKKETCISASILF
jgi:hypothetical protein